MTPLTQPYKDFLLVEPSQAVTRTSGGLAIPEEKKQVVTAPQRGTVVARGPDVSDLTPLGSDVYFDQYKGVRVDIDGTEYVSISESQLHGQFPRNV